LPEGYEFKIYFIPFYRKITLHKLLTYYVVIEHKEFINFIYLDKKLL